MYLYELVLSFLEKHFGPSLIGMLLVFLIVVIGWCVIELLIFAGKKIVYGLRPLCRIEEEQRLEEQEWQWVQDKLKTMQPEQKDMLIGYLYHI